MATKISLSIPDEDLAFIDAYAGGNRTAFMVAASLERARAMRGTTIDAQIAQSFADDDLAELVAEWDGTIADGLDDSLIESPV